MRLKEKRETVPAAGGPAENGHGGAADARAGGAGALPALLGAALVLIGLGVVLLASAFQRDAGIRALEGNLPVDASATQAGDISAHNSPALVRNPRQAANLVIANRIDSPRFSCALHVSFDGGGSWAQTAIPLPEGEEPKCYAPDVAFGSDGTLYLSFVTLKGRANAPNAVWLVSSDDGGRTLSDPVRALGPLSFQVRLTADPAAPRRLYLTWLEAGEVGLYKFTDPGNPIRAARSDDGGRTWTAPVTVSDSQRARVLAPSPAAGPDGELYVLYLDLGDDALDYHGAHRGQGGPPYSGRWQLVAARSQDRGATWTESVVDDELVPTERFIPFTPPFPSLAVDRRSGRVYAAFHDGRDGSADAWVWALDRGSERWRGPVRVNDTPRGDRSVQQLPKLAVAPDGRLDAVYYDRREDRAGIMNEVSFQASYDGGRSFLPRARLSDKAFDSRIGFGGERDMPDLGSRLALLSTDERAMAVWTDTRAGTRATGKQDLARGVVAVSAPEDLSGTEKTLLRVFGVLLMLAGAALLAYAVTRRRGH